VSSKESGGWVVWVGGTSGLGLGGSLHYAYFEVAIPLQISSWVGA
jgi:hypothetical protein